MYNLYNTYNFAGRSRLLLLGVLALFGFEVQKNYFKVQKKNSIPLPVTFALTKKALSVFRGAAFSLILGVGLIGVLALFGFALLHETGTLVHHHHMVGIFLYSSLHSLDHGEQFIHALTHPIHVIIHYKDIKA